MSWRRFATGLGRAIRDGWLILGVVIAMVLAIELLYRLQSSLRGLARPRSQAQLALDTFPWGPAYQREFAASMSMRWAPYLYFRRKPFAGRYITVDSSGIRRTVLPAPPGPRKVFFFGGSTMWGTYQDDAGTIPSIAARALFDRGITDLHVVNYGESGWVFTQELLQLLLLLRSGERPTAVVFYDGINDVASATQAGEAGLAQNEFNRRREFEFGRRLFNQNDSLPAELDALVGMAQAVSARAQFLQRLVRALPRAGGGAVPDSNALADAVASAYIANCDIIEALAARFGFTALYVWQPSLHATRKPLLPSEREMRDVIEHDGFLRRLPAVHRLAPARIEAMMGDVAPGRFVNLADAFDRDSQLVFLDIIGHTTPDAARQLADTITARLTPLLAAPRAPSRRSGGTR